jgi:nucleotide-binding universal stress UspA family protein
VRWGLASREIVRAAREVEADLIVLGMKPHGLLRRLLLGDTGLRVLQATSSTVLLARPYSKPELESAVLLCLDAPYFGAAAKAVEKLHLAPDNTRLHLAGFIEPPRLSPGVLPSYSDVERMQAEENKKTRQSTLETLFADAEKRLSAPGRRLETLIAEERLESGLKKVADDIQPDIIVVGAAALGGSLSSTSEVATVASLASCSVLVAR